MGKASNIFVKPAIGSIVVGLILFIAIMGFIYLLPGRENAPAFVSSLPTLNVVFNGLSVLFLSVGVYFIKKKDKVSHKRAMLTALVFSACFLISYLVYHHFQGDTAFLGQGMIRPIYFFILISHIFLTIVALPLILLTVFFALTKEFSGHKAVARWTFPIWMYISITGILIYFFIYIAN